MTQTINGMRLAFTILDTQRDPTTRDLLVYVEGQRGDPVRVPHHIAPMNSLAKPEHLAFIKAELDRRERKRMFADGRHDEYKGFRP